jgi:polygalacturonase/pectin methylesterase-like acyl-CoA thioesterase
MGSYTLFAIFCPIDATDYANAGNSVSYSVTQASTVAAVGASTMVVAPSGGNFTSVSAALAALPTTGGTIYIAPGFYYGQNVISYPNVSLRGLGGDATKVVLTAEDGAFSSPYAGYLGTGTGAGNASAQGDQGSSTLDVSKSIYMGQTAGSTSSPIGVTNSTQNTPVNFYAEYLTVQNTWDTDNFTKTTFQVSSSNCVGGFAATALSTLFNAGIECASQALALWITGDQAILNNVNLTSLQDTLYAGSQGASGSSRTPARQYMWKGTITGDVDYVFGDAALVFDHTNFFTAWHGSATGTDTIEAQNKGDQTGSSNDYLSGYICNSCTLLSQSTGMTNLLYGRPYGAYSTWIMLNSYVDQVNPAGWIEFSSDTNLPTSTYAEFNSIPYTDPAVGTAPYPAGLFFENSTIIPGYTGTPGYAVIPTGGNTGAGVTGTREVISQDPGTLEASNTIKTQLTAGQATQYAPQTFLSTTVPLQTYFGFSEGWNPQAVLAAQVNAFVPSTVINPIAFGSSVTILGRPQTPGAGVIPTGAYQFLDNGTAIASGSLDASGEAYFTSSTLTTGTHNITMVYGGDANFTSSTSGIYPITVLASGVPTTTTTLSIADTSATFGRPITGTVSVNPAAATGTATIYLDGASATTCTLSSGSCSWSVSSVAVGSHSIYAAYSGSGSYGASNSTITTVNVAAATATGDIRGVTEPSFPAVCTTLTAALTTDPAIQDLDASVDANNSNIDGARIQAAINSCAGTGQAVELSMDATGAYNAFLSGPLNLPSNVTLLVDPNVTVYFSRNAQDYDTTPGTHTCGTIAQTGGCKPLITIPKAATNVAIMGYGKLNGRGGDVIINAFPTSGCTYPVTPTPSWWDLAAAYTSPCAQENPIFVEMAGGGSTNITLYKITLLNAPTFHIGSASQVTGLTIWDIKISTPSYARNTDGIDPGDVSNLTIANNWVSDGDDNVALAGVHFLSQNDSVINNHFYAGHGESIGSYTGAGLNNVLFDGNMSAGNAFAGGSAISAKSATVNGTTYGAGYTDGNSTAIRIKTGNDRGGLVNNVQYSNSCFLNHKIDVLFTPYYDAGDSTNQFPNYPNILMQNLAFLNTASSSGSVEMTGEYNTNNGSPIDNPVTVTLDNVTFPSALSSLTNSTTPFESSATSSTWGSNFSGGTGQYANVTLGPGQVSSNFINAFNALATVPANNDNLTDKISQPALDPPNCVFTYIAPELTGPTGLPQTVPYGSTANLDVILMPIVSGSAFPTGNFTVNDTTTGQSFTSALTTTTDTHVVTIPASDLTVGTHTFTTTYLGDNNYTIPASYQTFGSYNVTVVQASQTIAFGTIPTQAPGAQLVLSATASSSLPVSFASTTTSVCTVSGSTASFLEAGNCSITASQPGNGNYNAATPVTQTFSVVTPPSISLTTSATVGGTHAGGYTMTITVKNTGTTAASNVTLNAASLGTVSGATLPQTWGSLAGGATATFTVTFPAGAVGLDGAAVAEKYSGSYAGGTYSASIRSVILP